MGKLSEVRKNERRAKDLTEVRAPKKKEDLSEKESADKQDEDN